MLKKELHSLSWQSFNELLYCSNTQEDSSSAAEQLVWKQSKKKAREDCSHPRELEDFASDMEAPPQKMEWRICKAGAS